MHKNIEKSGSRIAARRHRIDQIAKEKAMTGIMSVLARAVAFVMIIVTGYVLKKKGFFHADDFYLFSRVVVRITLPCAIISNFSKISMDNSLLFMCVVGLMTNLLMVGVGFLTNLHRTRQDRAFGILNLSGYNIGNFTLPFVQSFLGPVGFAATSLFDAGNAVMCTGVTYTMASIAAGTGDRPSVKNVLKSLFSSLPFDAYLIMTLLAVCRIPLPELVTSYAGTVGNANAFLALLMIGIGFEIRMEREKLAKMMEILILRYGMGVLMAVAAYLFLPFSLEVRQAIALIALGPVSSVAPAFTGKVGGDVAMASAVNSLSIIISIIMITGALMILL